MRFNKLSLFVLGFGLITGTVHAEWGHGLGGEHKSINIPLNQQSGWDAQGKSSTAPVKKMNAAVITVIDSDKDGVIDRDDACPGSPAGTKVNAKGCPVDSDGDGITDDKDACPGTPSGTKVDSRGCPVIVDSDGDGVSDDKDECPGSPVGSKVDASGCPQTVKAITDTWVLKGVNFETGSDKIKAESLNVLDEAAEIMKARTKVRVEIQGHTDSMGKPESNLALSERRALSVKNYLVGKGVSAAQLETKGYGQTQPVADNKTAVGRTQNRRIEFKVLSR